MRSFNQLAVPTKHPHPKQSGATLVIALILLVVLTLLVLSGVVTSSLGFRVAANMQQEREAAAAAQAAIDARLGNANDFKPARTTDYPEETIGAYKVIVKAPKCLGIDTREEVGKKTQVGVEPIPRYLWEYSATARNANTGVEVTVVQGVRVQMNIGSPCPN